MCSGVGAVCSAATSRSLQYSLAGVPAMACGPCVGMSTVLQQVLPDAGPGAHLALLAARDPLSASRQLPRAHARHIQRLGHLRPCPQQIQHLGQQQLLTGGGGTKAAAKGAALAQRQQMQRTMKWPVVAEDQVQRSRLHALGGQLSRYSHTQLLPSECD
jgi:hypothetical protein